MITDPELSWYRSKAELEALIETAPMIEITLDVERRDI